MSTGSAALPTEELNAFRQVQRLAYEAVTEVAAGLSPGVTEREAAKRVEAYLRNKGVRHFFHQPFAWFGDRARFAGFRTGIEFFPTRRKLEPGMCAILDVAPIVDGRAADVGYAFSCGPNAEVERAIGHLEVFRRHILESVLAEKSLLQLYREVDAMIADLGYGNCHRKYPFGVLAHRIERTRHPAASRPRFLGFGLGTVATLLSTAASARITRSDKRWPFWSEHLSPEARAEPGLWAIEPHMGRDGLGVKWEELLVVTPTTAFWLDDDVPHVRAWKRSAPLERERVTHV